MAFELPNAQTFFTGPTHDVNFRSADPDVLNAGEKSGRRTPRKSKSPNATATRRGKENPKQPATKNAGRTSQKNPKEPLKPLNADRKTPRKKGGALSPPKTARKSTPSPIKPKNPNKKHQNIPKIVVYEDDECRQRGQQRRVLSKSCEGRRSLPERGKAPGVSPTPRRTRHSFNDLPSLKSTSNKDKPGARGKATKLRSPKLRPEDPEFAEMLAKLEILFPGVDPEFLRNQLLKFKSSLSDTIEFILLKEKTEELPTRADHMRRLETENLHNKYLETFSVEEFLRTIPDPWDHFLRAERHNCARYASHSLHYLKNKFKNHYVQSIQEALAKNGHSLYLAHKELKKKNRQFKMRATTRSKYECGLGKPVDFDIQFVHEVAFVENESKIKAHVRKAEADKRRRLKKAEKEETLLKCQYCSELTLLPEEAVSCPANHSFCKDCVVKYVETEVEKSNFQFKCLVKCQERFPLESLKGVLSPGLVAKIINRNHQEEIKSAGIEDLVYCPFCYYAGVMPPELSVLKCLNPSCLAESCRHCKQSNHIPLKCHELEKFDKTISNETPTASPPRCVHCGKDFIKSEDSNKMDCPCGATMCSLCRQPFPECPHFNNPDGETSGSLSPTSEDTEYTEANEDHAENPDSYPENLHLLPSGSDSF